MEEHKTFKTPPCISFIDPGDEMTWEKAVEMDEMMNVYYGHPWTAYRVAWMEKEAEKMGMFLSLKPMEKDLNKNKLLTGETAAEYIKTRPEQYRSEVTEAIFECLRKNWPLMSASIQMITRGITSGRLKIQRDS